MPIRHGSIYAPGPGAMVDLQHDLGNGCVGYWCPSVSGGQGLYLPDISGQNNHGLLTNGPTWGAGQNAGEWGVKTVYESTQYISAPARALGTNPCTMVAMCCLSSGCGHPSVIGLHPAAPSLISLIVEVVVSTGYLRLQAFDNIANPAQASTFRMFDSQWHQVALSRGNGLLALYADGNLVASCVDTTTNLGGDAWVIGARLDHYIGYFNGLFGTSQVYNRALSAEQVARLYAQPYSMLTVPGRKSTWLVSALLPNTPPHILRAYDRRAS